MNRNPFTEHAADIARYEQASQLHAEPCPHCRGQGTRARWDGGEARWASVEGGDRTHPHPSVQRERGEQPPDHWNCCGGSASAPAPAAPAAALEGGGSGGARQCRCPLCGQQIEAETEEECVKHMEGCSGFAGVHPDGSGTPNTAYFDEQQGKRQQQQQAEAEAAVAAAAEELDIAFPAGSTIEIQGLTSAPELNGKQGEVLRWDKPSGRYRVQVAGREKPLGLRPKCCKLLAVVETGVQELLATETTAASAASGGGAPAKTAGGGGWGGWRDNAEVTAADKQAARLNVLTEMCGGGNEGEGAGQGTGGGGSDDAPSSEPEPEPEPES